VIDLSVPVLKFVVRSLLVQDNDEFRNVTNVHLARAFSDTVAMCIASEKSYENRVLYRVAFLEVSISKREVHQWKKAMLFFE